MPSSSVAPARVLLAIWLAGMLAACTTTLAPEYDDRIVERLFAVSERLMAQLAALAEGTEAETFGSREGHYNGLIGAIDALALQVRARPTPDNAAVERVSEALRERGIDLVDDDVPTAVALDRISDTLARMRETDRGQGITAMEAAAFRSQIVIYLDQALTYETHLRR